MNLSLKNNKLNDTNNNLYLIDDIITEIDNDTYYYLTKDGFLSKIVWNSYKDNVILHSEFKNTRDKNTPNDKSKSLYVFLKLPYNFSNLPKTIKLDKIYYDLPIYEGQYISEFIEDSRFYTPRDMIYFDWYSDSLLTLREVKIDDNYIRKTIIPQKIGISLEKYDTPGLFISIEQTNRGFIVVGKVVNNKIHLAGFIINYKCAIYLPSSVYYSNSYLVGKYRITIPNHSQCNSITFKHKNNPEIALKYVPLLF